MVILKIINEKDPRSPNSDVPVESCNNNMIKGEYNNKRSLTNNDVI